VRAISDVEFCDFWDFASFSRCDGKEGKREGKGRVRQPGNARRRKELEHVRLFCFGRRLREGGKNLRKTGVANISGATRVSSRLLVLRQVRRWMDT
jgi:hypothetical protein